MNDLIINNQNECSSDIIFTETTNLLFDFTYKPNNRKELETDFLFGKTINSYLLKFNGINRLTSIHHLKDNNAKILDDIEDMTYSYYLFLTEMSSDSTFLIHTSNIYLREMLKNWLRRIK